MEGANSRWQRIWLRIGAAAMMGFGAVTALGALPSTNGALVVLADLLVWPFNGAETAAATETRLLAAISGGLMIGWGVLFWSLAGAALDRVPDLVPGLVRRSILAWFAVDSLGSLAAGVPLNIVGNLGFLAVFLIPSLGAGRGETAKAS